MATINLAGVDEMIKRLTASGANVDKYAPEILKAAAGKLEAAIKQNLRNVVSSESSGEMLKSVKTYKPAKNKSGVWKIMVGFDGYDRVTGVPNNQKAMAMEYGTSKQPAKPFLRPAVAASENECLKIIQTEFERVLQSEH